MYDIYKPPSNSYDIAVYDGATLERIAIIDEYESFFIERSDFDIGRFELNVPLKAKGIEALRCGNIVSLGDSDARCGVIKTYQYDSERGSDTVTISGVQLKGLVLGRIIVPPTQTEDPDAFGWDRTSGTAEEVYRHYIDKHMIATNDPRRPYPHLALDDLHDPPRGRKTPWQCQHDERLADVLKEIGEWTQCGWDIRFDAPHKRFVAVINPGRNLTFGNEAGNDPVIFSRDYDNINVSRYTEDYSGWTNTPYIGGAGEDEQQLVLVASVDEAGNQVTPAYAGRDRLEAWVSAGNIDAPDALLYEGLHKYKGSTKRIRSLEAEILSTKTFCYGYAFDLGDTCTIQVDIGDERITLNERIVNVTEVYERGEMKIEAVFGESPATIEQRLSLIEKLR